MTAGSAQGVTQAADRLRPVDLQRQLYSSHGPIGFRNYIVTAACSLIFSAV